MKTYRGGDQATKGIYWNTRTGEFFQSPAGGTTLPGGSDVRYLRSATPVMLLMAPLLGLAYIVFLPVIGIVSLAAFLARRVAALAARAAEETAQVMVPAWVPGVSYLVRGQRRGRKSETAAAQKAPEPGLSDTIYELEQELRERRSQGER